MSELERIFLAALEIPEPQRDAFITNECGQNHALTRDVQSLLSHHRQETIPFSEILQPVATDLFNTASTATGIQPGQMLGPYRVERKVGEGGMGTVYAATDTRLQRQVAIKLLKRTFGDRSGALARFHKEARSAAALAHPNIATLYDFSESEGAPWMVMEFVDGASLRSKLTTQPFDAATILRYATQLAAALEHAHSRGIVHRDIKPENILIASDGTLKVIDFGIADALRETPLDAKGAFFGTLAYSAPELLAGGAVNEASDIYSFGAVVYEMGCGVHTGNVANHVNAATRNPALPANLASLIDRCLAPDPAGRYRNGGKLATALRSLSTIAQVSPEAVPALAILDFTNLAGEHALDWLGAGIAETLAARLSKLNSLRVATRSLVHQAAARLGVNDPSTIGRHLEAKWVVTGSFLKVADRVRITPQLIEAATGETSFAETIDGKWDDIFDLQDKAAQALANHLGGAGPQSPLPSLSRNLLAYESYSKGRQFLSQMRPSALASAIEQFEQAIALDPDYALANSALGTSYALQFLRTSNPEDAKRSGGYLERAILLDPEIGEPYPWLCNARMRRNDAAGAVAAGKKGVELHPDLGIAHYFYGGAAYMIAEARLIEPSVGVARLLEGIRLEPQRHAIWLVLGATAVLCGKHEPAIEILTETARMSDRPDLLFPFVGARTLRGIAWMRSGNWEKARECLEEVVANPEPEHFYRECFSVLNSCALGDVALRTGNAAEALNQYRRAWRMVKESPRMVGGERLLVLSAAGLASAYAATGDIDRAKELALDASGHIKDVQISSATFECGLAQLHLSLTVAMLRLGDADAAAGHLEKAQAKGWADLPWLLTDPELLPLHGHPAYTSFVETLRAAPDFDIPLPSSGRASQAADV